MNHRNKNRIARDQIVMGIHAIRELLLHAPNRLIRIYAELSKKGEERLSDLLQLSERKGVPFVYTTEESLEKMTGSDSHQSIAAQVKGRSFLDVKDYLKRIEEKENALVLMVDQIFDPQNFGSLIRCAECLGADGIVWSKNRGVDITPSAAKASCGGSELIPLIRISNLAEAVDQFQKGGFEVVAALLDPSAESAYSFPFASRTLLIVGSEGDGIQPLLRKKANRMIYIPMAGKIASLNVAASAAILMALYQKKRESYKT